jgi:hypothetical protein
LSALIAQALTPDPICRVQGLHEMARVFETANSIVFVMKLLGILELKVEMVSHPEFLWRRMLQIMSHRR